MGHVLLRLRVEVRTRWAALLAVGVLAGMAGGVTVAIVAGARRTETAYTRFLAGAHAFDVAVTNGGTTPENVNKQFDFGQLARRPEVLDAAPAAYYTGIGAGPGGRPVGPSDLTLFAPSDGRFGTELNGSRVLHGRRPSEKDEIALTVSAADTTDAGVGDVLHVSLTGPAADAARTPGPEEPFRVV